MTPELNVFRILAVDDDPGVGQLLERLIGRLSHPNELFVVRDGVEALNFLHQRGVYRDSPRPNLILLDIEMPRLNGLETLAVLKGDPELRFIPVIMLSTSDDPENVRRSYEAYANCYVLKPTSLERSAKLIEAVEAFWIEFAQEAHPQWILRTNLHGSGVSNARDIYSGPAIAEMGSEARSRAIKGNDPARPFLAASSGCSEHKKLLDEFGAAVQELLMLHEQQFRAIAEGDTECNRFDLLIHMANEQKQTAKYAYLRHVESHGCSKNDAANEIGA